MASIQQTSFTTPNYDYGADIAQIERRRALAQALQQQGMGSLSEQQQGSPPGGFTPHISPFQGAAKLAEIYAGKRQAGKADTQQRELAARTQKELSDVLRRVGLLLHRTAPRTYADESNGDRD
mgnify:CR=1 FL=1